MNQLVCAQATPHNDWYYFELKGNVKSLHQTMYQTTGKIDRIKQGNKEKDTWKKETHCLFNDKGYLVEEDLTNPSGALLQKFIYVYDPQLERVDKTTFFPDGAMASKEKFVYQYDDKGYITERDLLKGDDNLNEKITYKCNDKGSIIETNAFKADGIFYMKTTFGYDDNEKLIEKSEYESNGKQNYRVGYKVNGDGKRIGETWYEDSATFRINYVYRYDTHGNYSEISVCKKNGKASKMLVMEYVYDKNENWIREIEFENDKPSYIIQRTIEYF
ncbi:MAG: hypothetical protein NT126_04055 [Bacteroidetes bacterium]|nr:hypothetical protein [Bacteroidota bacterium]